MINKTQFRKTSRVAGAAIAIAMCPCLIAFGLGMAQTDLAAQDAVAFTQEASATPPGSAAVEGNARDAMETVQAAETVRASATESQDVPRGEDNGAGTGGIRKRAGLMAKVKHLADYASDGEGNPDYRRIGYVYTEEMYYKLTGNTELPDDWINQMDPLMRGIITEEEEFVETQQTDDGVMQALWTPDGVINEAVYQTAVYADVGQAAAAGAVQAAQRRIGYPYSQAGRDSGIAYDCSSLMYWSYLEAGVNIDPIGGHTAASIAQYMESTGRGIPGGDLCPGDLIFYSYKRNGRYKNISHVAMVVGDGMMVHASSSKKMVVMAGLSLDGAVAVARPVPDGAAGVAESAEDVEGTEGGTQEPEAGQYGPGIPQEPEAALLDGDLEVPDPEGPDEAAAEPSPVVTSGQEFSILSTTRNLPKRARYSEAAFLEAAKRLQGDDPPLKPWL